MRRGEVAAALFRLLIFATLLAALGVEAALAGHVHPLTVIVLLYGAATIAGLVLALLGRVGPGVAYLFVTFDVATLVAVLLMISMMGRFPGRGLFALPLAGFVFVILIHAAIRYRPALVGYGAVLFVTAVLATEVAVQRAPAVFERLLAHPAAHGAIEMSPAAGTGRHAISLALVGLAATLLIYLVWRMRQLLERAIAQEQRSTRLARFFAPAVARELAEAPPSTGLDGHRQSAAVMFIDIRGFTRLAETMAPHELGEMLREFRGAVGGCIREGEGVVDKFVGDAVLAVFGTPRPRADDAARALRAALDVLKRVAGWSAGRAKTGSPAIAVGIGLHYGEVFAGVLGDDAMLEHTVIGDTVNVAERLERLTRVLPGCLVVSEAIERAAGLSLDESRWQHLTAVQLEAEPGRSRLPCSATGHMAQPKELVLASPHQSFTRGCNERQAGSQRGQQRSQSLARPAIVCCCAGRCLSRRLGQPFRRTDYRLTQINVRPFCRHDMGAAMSSKGDRRARCVVVASRSGYRCYGSSPHA